MTLFATTKIKTIKDPAGRPPKHDLRSEQYILGACIESREALEIASGLLQESDYFSPAHQLAHQILARMYELAKPFSFTAFLAYAKEIGRLEDLGGERYIKELWALGSSMAQVEDACKVVRDLSRVRQCAEIAHKTAALCYDEIEDVDEFISEVSQVFSSVGTSVKSEQMRSAYAVAVEFLEEMANGQSEEMTCVKSGFAAIDSTCLFPLGDVSVIAGRPGMGKTACGLTVAHHIASKLCQGVAFFSLEMNRKQLIARLLSSLTGVPLQALVTKIGIPPSAWTESIGPALAAMKEVPLYLDDVAGITVAQMLAKLRLVKAGMKGRGVELRAVFVDYLQIMQGPQMSKGSTREQEVSAISRDLKRLAMDLNVHVFALAQLNRGVEGRPDPRPMLSDLRESGAIEQDASNVFLLYRQEYYVGEGKKFSSMPNALRGVCEVEIAKQRSGPTGQVYLKFEGESTSFRDLTDVQLRDLVASRSTGEAKPASGRSRWGGNG